MQVLKQSSIEKQARSSPKIRWMTKIRTSGTSISPGFGSTIETETKRFQKSAWRCRWPCRSGTMIESNGTSLSKTASTMPFPTTFFRSSSLRNGKQRSNVAAKKDRATSEGVATNEGVAHEGETDRKARYRGSSFVTDFESCICRG